MRYLLILPLIILAVGFGLVSAQAGALAVLLVLLVSGVLWRVVKMVAGALLILVSLG